MLEPPSVYISRTWSNARFSFLFPLLISCFPFLSSHILIVQEPYIITLNTEGSLLWPNVIKEKKINKYSINLLIKHKHQFLLCSLHNMGLLEMRTTWLYWIYSLVWKIPHLSQSLNWLHWLLEGWLFYSFQCYAQQSVFNTWKCCFSLICLQGFNTYSYMLFPKCFSYFGFIS